MVSTSSLWHLYLARLREFYRQPARIFWVYGFPITLALVLGLAFNSRELQPIVVDLIETEGADEVLATLESEMGSADSENATPRRPLIKIEKKTPSEADLDLLRGRVPLVVVPEENGQLLYRFDPTRPEAIAARDAFNNTYQRALGRDDIVATREELITEPGSRYIDFLVPGLVAMNAMGGGLWGVGFLLVNYRLKKLLKRFQATPMPRRDFLLAVIGARLTFLIPDITLLLGLGVFIFEMPIRGSLPLVILTDVIGAMAFAGIGLLVASRAESTETVSGLMNLVMIPMWLFSGVLFSYENFPEIIHPFIQLLPLTQLADALRLIILEGAGLVEVLPKLAILSVWGIVTFFLALRIFRWS